MKKTSLAAFQRLYKALFRGSQFILNEATIVARVRLLSNLSTNWKFIAKY